MKEATGEGSMTIVTIVVIIALAAAAVVVVATMTNKAESQADKVENMETCLDGYTWDATKNRCVKSGS